MCDYDIATILSGLENEMEAAPPQQPEPIIADKWLAASMLHKSIRRGDISRAINAASALWSADRQSFYRRLHVIALEDVGVANPGLLIQALTATSSSVWRRRQGDLRVALHLTRKLCESMKCRLSDETFIIAERSPHYAYLRAELAGATDETLAGYVTDESADLITRVLSIWFIAGTKKYPSDVMQDRKGEPTDAVELLRAMDAPVDLIESCVSVMSRTPYVLALITPLLWKVISAHPDAMSIQQTTLPTSVAVEGIPLSSCDMFTRVGGASVRQLQKSVPTLMQYSTKQVGLAQFYLEGGKCDRLLSSPVLDAYREEGEAADAEGNGMCLPSYFGLRETLMENQELLQEIRSAKLRLHLAGA